MENLIKPDGIECGILKNELVTNWHRFSSMKHSSHLPNAFTEHGVREMTAIYCPGLKSGAIQVVDTLGFI